ncbi:peptidoglycan DD-metalloendopeptidase family protein [Spirosoma sp. BT702]|uniref:Peptidoglycan DD-metalloendopeptidase family protein n=2 Tax=Spirosoma profusum TaxID=2771354 RepID=A0A926XV43_9BACT|nr:peptidoglycan DD-metalloendopeptidase family protein [Spirosoma profusum]
MCRFLIVLIGLSLCWLSGSVMAQQQQTQTLRNRQALEKEKRQNLERMTQINTILKQTTSEKQVGLGQLKALNQQIQAQSNQIGLLNKDIRLTETEIFELRQASEALTKDLNKLKSEYASMVYAADKRRQQINPLGFLFAADNFNQLVARYRYLRQYSNARQSQVRQMNNVRTMLDGKQQATQRKRQEQRSTLVTKLGESKKLESLKNEKNLVVKELSQKESELATELAESRRAVDRLEAMITRIIAREARERAEREARERAERERLAKLEAARKAAERKKAEDAIAAAAKAGEKPAPADVAKVESIDKAAETETAAKKPDERRNNNLNDEESALASSFTASRTRLPWPVTKGFISDHFGRKAHPVLKGIYVENQGIDIQTNAGEGVRSVYDGVVQDVTSMPGMNNVVAIQHGDYFTVYAKLKSVSVQIGQKVKARESIGTVATDKNGVSEIQFQIWKEFTKLNPETWLIPR